MMLKMFMKNKKGFTLVELMVVVVIIGILTAIAVPVYNNVTNNARNNAALADNRVVVSAVQMFQAANNGVLPDAVGDITSYLEGGALPAGTTFAYAAGTGVTITTVSTATPAVTTTTTIAP